MMSENVDEPIDQLCPDHAKALQHDGLKKLGTYPTLRESLLLLLWLAPFLIFFVRTMTTCTYDANRRKILRKAKQVTSLDSNKLI